MQAHITLHIPMDVQYIVINDTHFDTQVKKLYWQVYIQIFGNVIYINKLIFPS